MSRSVGEMMDAQRFLEKYADTPVSDIDAEKARMVLQRSGFLTKANKISAKYEHVVIKSTNSISKTPTSTRSVHKNGRTKD